jgi:branched-chain amino acid transport system substrate-binding protein
MAFGAGLRFRIARRSVWAIRPLLGTASRYQSGVRLVAIGVLFGVTSGFSYAQAPIRIGASLGMTGVYAEFGEALQRGYQLCVNSANAKGGVLGRKLDLTVVDDKSDTPTAVAIYERLITQDKVDLVFSPYSSPMTNAVAAVTEKYGRPMVAAGAASPSIFKKRQFLFMLLSPAESYLEGLIDLAAKRGLKTVALIYEDTVFPKGVAQGAAELAKKRGLQVVALEGYPRGNKDFTAVLSKFKAANPDVIAAAGYYDDAVAIMRSVKELDLNPKMLAPVVGSGHPKFHETLGRSAEYVYVASPWEADLVNIRAGGLVPIARQYPGAREFVEAYRKEFSSGDMTYQTAQAYGACQLLLEGVRRAGALDNEKIRAEIAKNDTPSTFGGFKLGPDGVQIGHKILLFQWQDGKKVIVWPEELAADRPRFPTPPWNQRR